MGSVISTLCDSFIRVVADSSLEQPDIFLPFVIAFLCNPITIQEKATETFDYD